MDRDESVKSRMVDIGDKPITARRAVAEGMLELEPAAREALDRAAAGDASLFETARLAGIMAAKRTSDLLPLCHPIGIDHVEVEFERVGDRIRIVASAATRAATGIEMEALTAVMMSGLAIVERLGSAARGAALLGVRLIEKTGGRSGDYRAREESREGA